jgi:hypothetical protein
VFLFEHDPRHALMLGRAEAASFQRNRRVEEAGKYS